jgi:hypothetical protein
MNSRAGQPTYKVNGRGDLIQIAVPDTCQSG